jgi:hypothetical protein
MPMSIKSVANRLTFWIPTRGRTTHPMTLITLGRARLLPLVNIACPSEEVAFYNTEFPQATVHAEPKGLPRGLGEKRRWMFNLCTTPYFFMLYHLTIRRTLSTGTPS